MPHQLAEWRDDFEELISLIEDVTSKVARLQRAMGQDGQAFPADDIAASLDEASVEFEHLVQEIDEYEEDDE